MKDFGIGIIGCGNISETYLHLIPRFAGLEVRAVADRLPEAAKARSDQFGVRAQTPEALLANDEIDIVVNLTVPDAHYEVSSEILSAGKHAYSEKPFALTLEQAEALRNAASARDLRVGSAPDTFLGGAHQQARALVDEGRIGRLTSGTAHVMGRGMEHWHPNPDFFFKKGAGPMLDLGPYYITALVHLLGPVRRVTALSGSAREERLITSQPRAGERIVVETPTTIHAIAEFGSGAIVTIGASWDVYAHGHHNIELYGTDGSLFVPDPNWFDGKIELTGQDGTRETVAPWQHPFGVPNWPRPAGPDLANYRAAGLADMARAIEAGRPARCDIALATHVVDVMTAILHSGESGEMITLTTTCERPEALGPDEARALLRAN